MSLNPTDHKTPVRTPVRLQTPVSKLHLSRYNTFAIESFIKVISQGKWQPLCRNQQDRRLGSRDKYRANSETNKIGDWNLEGKHRATKFLGKRYIFLHIRRTVACHETYNFWYGKSLTRRTNQIVCITIHTLQLPMLYAHTHGCTFNKFHFRIHVQ